MCAQLGVARQGYYLDESGRAPSSVDCVSLAKATRRLWPSAGHLPWVIRGSLGAGHSHWIGVRLFRCDVRGVAMVDRLSARRGVLPIPDRPHLGLVTYDAKDPDTAFPPIEPLLPPEGAPNVLVVLLDDVGFGAGSAFGGPAQTPTAERLQRGGLTYNRFHTTALCAPTRAALLSGRNHHSVGMGMITETATSAPGSTVCARTRRPRWR